MANEQQEAQRVNLFLDPKLVEKAKIQAIKENVSFSKLVDKALDEYVKTQRK